MRELPELTPDAIAALADWPPTSGHAFVRANMVMTLDGTVIGRTGTSRAISSPEDHELLLHLRRDSDAILVGAGTARIEGYRRPMVPLAVVSRGLGGLLDVPAIVGGDVKDRPRPIVITTHASDRSMREAIADHADIEFAGDDSVDLKRAMQILHSRGLRRIHCEGGPHLLTNMLHQDLIDELYCAVTPRLLGSGPDHHLISGLDLAARRLTLRAAYTSAGTVFLRFQSTKDNEADRRLPGREA